MLDICFDQGSKLDIQFNRSKSCLFKSGPGYNQLLPNLHIGNEPIFWLMNLNIWVYILIRGKSLRLIFYR